ncbi:MAG: hypothetical protein ABID38_04755 [Candidatus Diapherotrites archaeon]
MNSIEDNTVGLLNKQLNTVSALRKLTSFEIEQGNGYFSMRPQMHLLIVKPFGTIKSSYTHKLEELLGDDVVVRDELTKPAILGTISKDKTYVPGLPAEIGGKILVVDEFNNLGEFGLKALLGVLENQRINRQLGFAVKEPESITPNEWTNLTVSGGSIEGTVNFSCIAYAMFYPKPKVNSLFEENPQSLLGLKSRFTPNFSCPEHGELMDALRGEQSFDLRYFGLPVRHVLIKKQAYTQYIESYSDLTKELSDKHLENLQIGFLTRVSSDILRFAVHEVMEKEVPKSKTLEITDSEVLIQQAELWTEPLLKQYLYEEHAGSYNEFVNLFKEHSDKTNKYYAQKLNKSVRQIQRWKKKYEDEKIERGVIA